MSPMVEGDELLKKRNRRWRALIPVDDTSLLFDQWKSSGDDGGDADMQETKDSTAIRTGVSRSSLSIHYNNMWASSSVCLRLLLKMRLAMPNLMTMTVVYSE